MAKYPALERYFVISRSWPDGYACQHYGICGGQFLERFNDPSEVSEFAGYRATAVRRRLIARSEGAARRSQIEVRYVTARAMPSRRGPPKHGA
jgi:predicted RNA-binding Zn ribbon-like protein